MISPCKTCAFLCDDKGACCFRPIVSVPWSEPEVFDEYPEECAMLADLEEWLEEIDESDPMVYQVQAYIERLKACLKPAVTEIEIGKPYGVRSGKRFRRTYIHWSDGAVTRCDVMVRRDYGDSEETRAAKIRDLVLEELQRQRSG